MKKWVSNCIAGVIVYGPVGWLITLFMDADDKSARWPFIITFTVCMTIAELTLFSWIRKRFKQNNAK